VYLGVSYAFNEFDLALIKKSNNNNWKGLTALDTLYLPQEEGTKKRMCSLIVSTQVASV
jgi:hypothetical protein